MDVSSGEDLSSKGARKSKEQSVSVIGKMMSNLNSTLSKSGSLVNPANGES